MTLAPDSWRGQILSLVLLLVWVACGAMLFRAWLGGAYGPVIAYTISPSQMAHDDGCAYVVGMPTRFPGWPFAELTGDSLGRDVSRLALSEDDRSMVNLHGAHAAIRASAPHGYSHWRSKLYFSAADCSDPRTNGRRYNIAAPVSPSILTYGVGFLLWTVLGLALTRGCTIRSPASPLCRLSRTAVDLCGTPVNLQQRKGIGAGVAIALILVCWLILVSLWSTNSSTGLVIAGLYPISDASGYWICANSLLDNGHFGYPLDTGEWCQRRAIYPTFLAGLNLIGARQMIPTLMLQAAMVAAAIFVLIRRLSPHLPAIATLACAGLLLAYAADEAFPVTMTENAGLIFGCLGLAMLLRAADDRSLRWLVGGAAILSLALNARAGAFFALPALVLWAGLVARLYRRRIWLWVAATTLALAVGFAVQNGVVRAVGGDPSASQGNFAYTLYGLSVGGKGWTQVLRDHPELAADGSDRSRSQAIYALAWKNLTAHPGLFLEGISQNLLPQTSRGTYGYHRLGAAAPLAMLLWWLGWLPLIRKRRDPRHLMVALLSLGVMASAPVMIGDGGMRVFAATVPVDALQIAIAVAGAASLLRRARGSQSAEPAPKALPSAAEPAVTLLALGILILPLTPLARLGAQPPTASGSCVDGQETVVTRINRGGTVALAIVDNPRAASFIRGRVDRESLFREIPTQAWWRQDLLALTGGSLLRAYQLQANDLLRPGPYNVFADQDLSPYNGKLVRLCLDPRDTRRLFEEHYRRLRSITPLE